MKLPPETRLRLATELPLGDPETLRDQQKRTEATRSGPIYRRLPVPSTFRQPERQVLAAYLLEDEG